MRVKQGVFLAEFLKRVVIIVFFYWWHCKHNFCISIVYCRSVCKFWCYLTMFSINLHVYLIYYFIVLNNQRLIPSVIQCVGHCRHLLYCVTLGTPRHTVLITLAAIGSFVIKCLNQICKHRDIVWIGISHRYLKRVLITCYMHNNACIYIISFLEISSVIKSSLR